MSHNSNTSGGGATSIVASLHSPQVGGKPATVKSSAGNVVEVGGDMSLWDTSTGKFVLVDQSNVGTTSIPKL